MIPSLRIAVIGLGGIGSTFAFQLARLGRHEVTAIARPNSARLQQLQRDGGIVNVAGERAEVRVTGALDEQIPYGLVLVTLLAHQVDAVLPALQRCAARCVQFMFNHFEPERLRDALGAGRCSFGMPFVQATVDGDGRLRATIGAGGQKSKMSRQDWVDVFIAASLPAVLEPDMLLWLRCHVSLCVAFESESVAGERRKGGAPWGGSMVLARGMHESFVLVRRLRFRLYPSGKSWLHRSPARVVAGLLWLVSRVPSFRELLATAAGECRALADVMAAAAAQANPPVEMVRIQAMKP